MSDFETRAAAIVDRIGESPPLDRLLAIWKAGCVSGLAPRSAIDPIDLAGAGLMPDLFVVERAENGEYRYRLVGESIRHALQTPVAGRFVDEVYPKDIAEFVSRRYAVIIGKGCVEYSVGHFLRRRDEWHTAKRLTLPLTDETGVSAFAIGVAEVAGFTRFAGDADDPLENYSFIDAVPWRYFVEGAAATTA